jgi:outer membrane lipoprotein-sorting protein
LNLYTAVAVEAAAVHLLLRSLVLICSFVCLGLVAACTYCEQIPLARSLASPQAGGANWMLETEQTLAIHGGADRGESKSTAQIWYAPGFGWRVDIKSSYTGGASEYVSGNDGTTAWAYDASTNQYTLQPATPSTDDPQLNFLGGEFGLPAAGDLGSELAVWRRIPGSTLTEQGTKRVAGRLTRQVLITPGYCSGSGNGAFSAAGVATATPTTSCGGSFRYWFDAATGWALRAVVDAGPLGSFTMDTISVNVNNHVDAKLFTFTPPPGSVQVASLS